MIDSQRSIQDGKNSWGGLCARNPKEHSPRQQHAQQELKTKSAELRNQLGKRQWEAPARNPRCNFQRIGRQRPIQVQKPRLQRHGDLSVFEADEKDDRHNRRRDSASKPRPQVRLLQGKGDHEHHRRFEHQTRSRSAEQTNNPNDKPDKPQVCQNIKQLHTQN